MNNVKTVNEPQVKRPEAVMLLDCGQASKVTKGMPYMIFWEMSTPPNDTSMSW